MVVAKKISKSVITTIPLLLETKNKEKSTELSKYIWELQINSINYDLKWSIACKAHPHTSGTRKNGVCLTEKLAIMKADPEFVFFVFFLSGFSFTTIHKSQNCRGRGRVFL